MDTTNWNARRILHDLCDGDRRLEIMTCFWNNGDDMSRGIAVAQLAKSLRFRESSMRKLPVAKKAQLLASRSGAAEFEELFESALLAFHLAERKELMAAFLDAWAIPHDDGAIEEDDYPVPSRQQVADAIDTLGDRFDRGDMMLYLATAGLVMGGEGSDWRMATWPVVDESIADH